MKRYWFLFAIVLVIAAVGCAGARGRAATTTPQTATVTTITATDAVETSGTIEALQSATLAWKSSGVVAEILVSEGQTVNAGDILARLDITTAPQNVIAAQADLINAQNSLDALLQPSELALARAEKAIVDAQVALEQAQARANGDLGSDAEAQQAQATLTLAQAQLQEAEDRLAELTEEEELDPLLLAQAEKSVADAQVAVEQAQQRLDGAFGSEAEAEQAQMAVTVAELALADAQSNYDSLLTPDANDVAALEARVAAAQATLDSIEIVAPFAGEVVVLNALVGDVVQAGLPAVVLANRAELQLTAAIDEADIGQIELGDVVNVTVRSLDDQVLPGRVDWMSEVGNVVQGLVRYDVRIVLEADDSAVRLGMTADLEIITDVQENALAVPLDAVQLDGEGEFVNRLRPDNSTERVSVQSGQVNGSLVVIIGNINVGDRVELAVPQPTSGGTGPFGN